MYALEQRFKGRQTPIGSLNLDFHFRHAARHFEIKVLHFESDFVNNTKSAQNEPFVKFDFVCKL